VGTGAAPWGTLDGETSLEYRNLGTHKDNSMQASLGLQRWRGAVLGAQITSLMLGDLVVPKLPACGCE